MYLDKKKVSNDNNIFDIYFIYIIVYTCSLYASPKQVVVIKKRNKYDGSLHIRFDVIFMSPKFNVFAPFQVHFLTDFVFLGVGILISRIFHFSGK